MLRVELIWEKYCSTQLSEKDRLETRAFVYFVSQQHSRELDERSTIFLLWESHKFFILLSIPNYTHIARS